MLTSGAFFSCNIDMPCQEATDVFLRAQLCRIDSTGKERNVTALVSVKACDYDSVWYREKSLSLLELPLKPNDTQTSFEIALKTDSIWHEDILTIYHENQSFFISMECGAIVKHRISGTEIGRHDAIKELMIINEEVDNLTHTHLKIYVE